MNEFFPPLAIAFLLSIGITATQIDFILRAVATVTVPVVDVAAPVAVVTPVIAEPAAVSVSMMPVPIETSSDELVTAASIDKGISIENIEVTDEQTVIGVGVIQSYTMTGDDIQGYEIHLNFVDNTDNELCRGQVILAADSFSGAGGERRFDTISDMLMPAYMTGIQVEFTARDGSCSAVTIQVNAEQHRG